MTFLFLGLDGMDYELAEEFDQLHRDDEDIPVELQRLEQDMPEYLADDQDGFDPLGWWTFYLWGAIASGKLETPMMEIEHFSPDDLDYKSGVFPWEDPDLDVKVINWPICLPEFNYRAEYFRDDRVSTDYDRIETHMLRKEINHAVEEGFDAVFACTRIVDTSQHAATRPENYNAESHEQMVQGFAGRSFDDLLNLLPTAHDIVEADQLPGNDARQVKENLVDAVFDWVAGLYQELDRSLLQRINWDGVDDHILVSDHGFDRLGAGDVRSHGRNAVISSSIGDWGKMSEFIPGWRREFDELMAEKADTGTVDRDRDAEIRQRLADLGYNV